jgi:hypothetical protein
MIPIIYGRVTKSNGAPSIPHRGMKTTSSRSNLAIDTSKTRGGALRLALFAWCVCAAIASAACVAPPNGTWQSQPGPQQHQAYQDEAAAGEAEAAPLEAEAAAYDNEAFLDGSAGSGGGRGSGHGGGTGSGDDGGGDYGGGGDDGRGGGGGGGRQWLCTAKATYVNDAPSIGTGVGNSQEEAAQQAMDNCLTQYNLDNAGAYLFADPKTAETFCTVTECN